MISAKLVVTKDPVRMADQLKAGLRNRVIRIAMNKAASVCKQAIVSAAPARTGALRDSMRIRILNYNDKLTWVAVIGPSMKFKRTLRRKSKNREGLYYRPARIAHIVEKKQHFTESAYSSSRQAFLDILTDKLKEQIEQILSQ